MDPYNTAEFQMTKILLEKSLCGMFFVLLSEPVEWNDTIDKERALESISEQNIIIKTNQAMLDQYHIGEEEFIRTASNMLFHYTVREGRLMLRKLFDEGHLFIDSNDKRSDGSMQSIVGDYICMHNEKKQIIGCFGMQMDIVKRKTGEENESQDIKALQLKNKLLEGILNKTPVGIWLLDENARSIFANKYIRDRFDLSLHEGDACRISKHDTQDKESLHHYDEIITSRDNKQHKFETVKTKIDWENGSVTGVLRIGIDKASQKETVEALRSEKEKFKLLTDNTADMLWVYNLERKRFAYISPSVMHLRGYTQEEALAQTIEESLAPDSASAFIDLLEGKSREFLNHPDVPQKTTMELRQRCKNGKYIWVEAAMKFEFNEQNEIVIIGVNRDIQKRKEAEEALQLEMGKYQIITENIFDFVWVYSVTGKKTTYISPSIHRLAGYTPEEMLGEKFEEIFTPESKKQIFEQFPIAQNTSRRYSKMPEGRHVEAEIYNKNGDRVWIEAATKYYLNSRNEIELIGVSRSINERKSHEKQIQFFSFHDSLTGLYNRNYLDKRAAEEMSRADRYNKPLSMVMFDIDHFKKINDTWGHPVGDMVLKQLAEIIQKLIRKSDILFRLGGDEFILLLPEITKEGAITVSEKIRTSVNQYDNPVAGRVTASFGIAERIKLEPFANWYKRIDSALYFAKQKSRNCISIAEDFLIPGSSAGLEGNAAGTTGI
jgi:diguanylate cyclase (GGDEF)-like protein/PAS domain S-box-containing protein